MKRASILLAALFAVGCAQNAVLEIELQLPGPPLDEDGQPLTPYTEASVRFALDTDGVENDIETFQQWTSGDGPTPRSFSLAGHREEDPPRRSFPSNMRLSVRTGQVDADLLLQIRFCRPGVCDENAPELRYRIEHPFYRGQRTFLRTGPLSPGAYTYNLEQDFPELCQQPTTVDPNVRVIWRCRIEGCFDSTIGEVVSADYGWCSMRPEPGYAMPADASCDDGGARVIPDAAGSVLGEIDVAPQHFCERARGCSVGPTTRTGLPSFAASMLVLGVVLFARRRREGSAKPSR